MKDPLTALLMTFASGTSYFPHIIAEAGTNKAGYTCYRGFRITKAEFMSTLGCLASLGYLLLY